MLELGSSSTDLSEVGVEKAMVNTAAVNEPQQLEPFRLPPRVHGPGPGTWKNYLSTTAELVVCKLGKSGRIYPNIAGSSMIRA